MRLTSTSVIVHTSFAQQKLCSDLTSCAVLLCLLRFLDGLAGSREADRQQIEVCHL